jgi:hypothetical protein
MAKQLTYDQIAERKRKAEQFLRDVKGDEERADEVADEPVESYAERRHFTIIDNSPRRRNQKRADTRTRQDLLDQIAGLQDENDSLRSQLDAISDILDQDQDGDDDDDGDKGD